MARRIQINYCFSCIYALNFIRINRLKLLATRLRIWGSGVRIFPSAPFLASIPAERIAFRPVRIIAGVQMVVHYDEGICSLSLSEARRLLSAEAHSKAPHPAIRKIEVSLRTKSESKAARPAAALSDRLERYWDSLRDRLRTIECPADIIDAIDGWTTEGIGHQYAQGHSLTVMHGWMKRLV